MVFAPLLPFFLSKLLCAPRVYLRDSHSSSLFELMHLVFIYLFLPKSKGVTLFFLKKRNTRNRIFALAKKPLFTNRIMTLHPKKTQKEGAADRRGKGKKLSASSLFFSRECANKLNNKIYSLSLLLILLE